MTVFSDLMSKAATSTGGDGDFENLPPGEYVMKLTNCFRNKAKNGEGRNQTNLDFEVVEGDKKGETHRAWHNLDHHVGISIMTKELGLMGIVVPSTLTAVEQVDPYLREAQAMALTLQVKLFNKTRNGQTFLNTKIVSVLGASATDVPAVPVNGVPASSAVPAVPSAAIPPIVPAVPEEPATGLSVGAKIRYMIGGNETSGVIMAVNKEAQTVDTVIHKAIPLTDITALM